MKKLIIVSPKHKQITPGLKQSLTGVEVEGCASIYELEARASRGFITYDTVLIRDDAIITEIGTEDLPKASQSLLSMFKSDLFESKQVFALVTTDKPQRADMFRNVFNSARLNTSTEFKVIVMDGFSQARVKEILINTSNKFEKKELEEQYVVKVKRGKEVNKKLISKNNQPKPVMVLLPNSNTSIDDTKTMLKEAYSGETLNSAYEAYQQSLGEYEPELHPIVMVDEEEIVEINADQVLQIDTKKAKVVLVTGEARSGSSTISMILAATGSRYKKTLVIDANWNNLGLSYLVEKTIAEEEINNIAVEDIALNKLDSLKNRLYDEKPLHVLSLSLTVKKLITRHAYMMLVASIIKYAKNLYDTIIVDANLADLEEANWIISQVDKLLITTPIYHSQLISMMTAVKKSILAKTHLFSSKIENDTKIKDTIIVRTAIFGTSHDNIKALARPHLEHYMKEVWGAIADITSIYVYNKSYLDPEFYTQIFEKIDGGVN